MKNSKWTSELVDQREAMAFGFAHIPKPGPPLLLMLICLQQIAKNPRTVWQESYKTCPITNYGFVFPGKFSMNGYHSWVHFLLKMPVPFTSVRLSLYCSPVIKQWTFLSYLDIADLPWLVLFRKIYLVEFLLRRKRETEVRFWIMNILNVISTGRKGIKFSPIFLHSYKRKKAGCICVMCSCLKVVLFLFCIRFTGIL